MVRIRYLTPHRKNPGGCQLVGLRKEQRAAIAPTISPRRRPERYLETWVDAQAVRLLAPASPLSHDELFGSHGLLSILIAGDCCPSTLILCRECILPNKANLHFKSVSCGSSAYLPHIRCDVMNRSCKAKGTLVPAEPFQCEAESKNGQKEIILLCYHTRIVVVALQRTSEKRQI
jgi:hypothetical protein